MRIDAPGFIVTLALGKSDLGGESPSIFVVELNRKQEIGK